MNYRPDQTRRHSRAAQRRAVYPHVQGQGVRDQGERRRVWRSGVDTRLDRADRDPAPGRHHASCWCMAAGRSSPSFPKLSASRRAWCRAGASRTRSPSTSRRWCSTASSTRGSSRICRELDIDAVGISGVDAGLMRAHQAAAGEARGRRSRRSITASWATSMRSTPTCLRKLLDNGLMPVVSPLSADRQRHAAQHQCRHGRGRASARRSSAEKLMLCTGAPGILERLDDPRSLISYTDLNGLKRLRDERQPRATACCRRRRRSRRRSAAACVACT